MIVENNQGYKLIEYIKILEEEINRFDKVTSAGVVVEVNNKYLFGFNNWRKQWELPVGGIENNENPKETAIRELFEETHQDIKNIEFKGLFKKLRKNGEEVYSAIYYCKIDKLTEFIKQDGDENDEIMLWDLNEIIGLYDEIDKCIVEIIKENL